MLRLFLVRHGECDMNLTLASKIGGRSDTSPLTEKGVQQAKQLGIHLASKGQMFTKECVYSSTAVRARKTCDYVCEGIGFPIEDITRTIELHEIDQGDWEGALRDECFTKEMIDKRDQEGENFSAPNGESQRDVEERMFNFVQSHIQPLCPDEGVKEVLIVSHSFAIKTLLRKLLDTSKNIYKHDLENTALSIFHYHKREASWTIHSWNNTEHFK